jgi:hypothetical protein
MPPEQNEVIIELYWIIIQYPQEIIEILYPTKRIF